MDYVERQFVTSASLNKVGIGKWLWSDLTTSGARIVYPSVLAMPSAGRTKERMSAGDKRELRNDSSERPTNAQSLKTWSKLDAEGFIVASHTVSALLMYLNRILDKA